MVVTQMNNGEVLRRLKESLPAQYHKYLKVFAPETARKLPEHREWDYAIDLQPGSKVPWGPIYALSEVELQALREYLDEMIAQGKIRPSKSPAGHQYFSFLKLMKGGYAYV